MATIDNVSLSPETAGLLDRLIRRGMLAGFGLSTRLSVRLHIMGRHHFENRPGQIILLNHKDDFDSIMILPVLLGLCKNEGPIGRMGVVAAEQIFERGFLTHELLDHPWLSRISYGMRVGRFVEALGWRPIAQGRLRFLASHLEDLLLHEGNLTLSEVFGERYKAYFPSVESDAGIQSIMNATFRQSLYTPCDFSVFTAPIAEALKARHGKRIDSQLSVFGDMLTRGRAVLIAPEGLTDCDGRIGRIKSGLSQIISKARCDVSIMPVYPTYDYMSTGRSDAFVAIGPALRGVNNWSRETLEQEASGALTSLITVTMGHLASHRVRRLAEIGQAGVDERRLKGMVRELLDSLRNRDVHVDPALCDEKRFERRWGRLMAYCTGKGLLRRDGATLRFDPKNVMDNSVPAMGRASAWSYHDNEFQSLMEQAALRQEPLAQTG